MKYPAGIVALMAAAAALFAYEWAPMEIRTQDGQVFPEASVEQLTPSMIDISYVKDGHVALKGLNLSELTPELQEKFHYDPKAAAEYQARIEKYKNIDLARGTSEDLAALPPREETEEEKLARIRRSIESRLAGKDIEINPDDLDYVLTAGRRAVTVSTVEPARNGTVVRVLEDQSTREKLPGMIMIHDVKLAEGRPWTGFIYPTGLKARLRGENQLPVFCDSLEAARELLDIYLDIYSEFALNNTPASPDAQQAAQPPDQSVADAQQQTQQQTSAADNSSGIDYKGYGYSYYLGGSYWPVYWYRNYHPWRPRPPRPPRPPWPGPPPPRPPHPGHRPDRPDQPDRPHRPDRPDKPDRPDRPDRPNPPPRPQPQPQPRPVSPLQQFQQQLKPRPVSPPPRTGYREIPVRSTISGHELERSGRFRR